MCSTLTTTLWLWYIHDFSCRLLFRLMRCAELRKTYKYPTSWLLFISLCRRWQIHLQRYIWNNDKLCVVRQQNRWNRPFSFVLLSSFKWNWWISVRWMSGKMFSFDAQMTANSFYSITDSRGTGKWKIYLPNLLWATNFKNITFVSHRMRCTRLVLFFIWIESSRRVRSLDAVDKQTYKFGKHQCKAIKTHFVFAIVYYNCAVIWKCWMRAVALVQCPFGMKCQQKNRQHGKLIWFH